MHTMGPKRCFWIPKMGVFEIDNAKNIVWVQVWRPKHSYVCTPWARKGVFGYLGLRCLQWTMPNNIVWVLGWRPKHPYLCTPWVRKPVFGYLGWGCLQWTMPNKLFGFRGGAPNTHMSAHHGTEKSLLDIRDGVVCNGQCQKNIVRVQG